jgi:hypothetical protein
LYGLHLTILEIEAEMFDSFEEASEMATQILGARVLEGC